MTSVQCILNQARPLDLHCQKPLLGDSMNKITSLDTASQQ